MQSWCLLSANLNNVAYLLKEHGSWAPKLGLQVGASLTRIQLISPTFLKLADNKRSNLQPIFLFDAQSWCLSSANLNNVWPDPIAKTQLPRMFYILPWTVVQFSQFLNSAKLLSRLALCDERTSVSWSIQSSTLGQARIQPGLDLEKVMKQVSWREMWYQKQTFDLTFISYLLL